MSNMSYCRFQNTLNDLQDCQENLFDEVSEAEERARKKLIQICIEIAEEFENYDEDED